MGTLQAYLILSLTIGLSLALADPPLRLQLKGYKVIPRNETQVEALVEMRSSNDHCYFRGGEVRVNHESEVWVSSASENSFLEAMNTARMSYIRDYYLIKVKQYQDFTARWRTGNIMPDSGDTNNNGIIKLMDKNPDSRCSVNQDCDIGRYCNTGSWYPPIFYCQDNAPGPNPGTFQCGTVYYVGYCQGGGTCIYSKGTGVISCICPPGRYGQRCEYRG